MKLLYLFLLSFVLWAPVYAICDETGSSGKRWTLEARDREDFRQKHPTDTRSYPTESMYCGKGFSNGLAKVLIDGKAGFIDRSGRLVIKATLRDAGRFSEGLAPFEAKTRKWGYINTKGEVVIQPRFDWAVVFREGRGLVQIGEKWGFIDSTGKTVIEPRFHEADSFSEGLAHVQLYLVGESPGQSERTRLYKSGYIDNSGKWVIEPRWDVGESFDGGMARVSRDVGYKDGVISESIFIDKTGKQIWKLESWYLAKFTGNLLVAAVGGSTDGFTAIDRSGKRTTTKVFNVIGEFVDGLAPARLEKVGKYGYINPAGEFVIPPQFEWAHQFSSGLAPVRQDSQHFGLIDTSGKLVVQPKFDWIWEFHEGFALAAERDKTGYIDRTGRYIWKPTK